jgi:hypothetical protein
MAYFIFLKYLRSLDEFRKNPHVKISLKYPCANFQSIGIFKNSIFIQKRIFSVAFGPSALSSQPRPTHFSLLSNQSLPLSPLGLGLSAGPSRPLGPADRALVAPCRIAASHTGRCLQPRCLCPLRAWLTGGPHLASLTSGSTELGRAATFFRRSPHRPAPHLGCRLSHYSPCHYFPLNTPLNLAPVFNGVKAINAAVTPPGHLSPVRPTPIKFSGSLLLSFYAFI